jgi:DNA-damage-inducible protein D
MKGNFMDGDIISAQDLDGQIRKTLHNDETHYSLVDIMAVFSDLESRPDVLWKRTRERLQDDGFQPEQHVIKLKLRAKDGKMRDAECADLKTCLRVVQSIPSPKAEPVREWLAHQGAMALQRIHYLKQGKSHEWIDQRLEGKIRREEFTDALKAAVYDAFDGMYGVATNELYRGLWNRTAAALRDEIGLKPHTPLRDHQHDLALAYQRIAESVISRKLGEAEEISWNRARLIVQYIAQMIGAQARETGKVLGIDLPTNKPLLND